MLPWPGPALVFAGQCARWRDGLQVDVSCPGRDAAFFMPLRRTGTPLSSSREQTGAPALQRTASQELRAALRPGHERKLYAMNIRAADASVSSPPKAMKIFPISEV